jgi:hypothetical protein
MDADVDRRLNYFTGQLLQEQDFREEQAYHLDRLRRHNRQLHTPGITDGLEVDAQLGASEVTVARGTAVDDEGRLIVLPAEKKMGLGDQDARGATRTLVISYHQVSSDPSTVGGTGDTRIREDPGLDLVEQPAAGQVPLALLTIDNDGKLTKADPAVRGQAGARLGGDVEVGRLTISRLGIDRSLWPSLTVGDGGGLSVQGDARLNDKTIFLRTGTDTNHGIGYFGGGKTFSSSNPDGPVVFGFSGGALGSTNGGQKLALTWDNSQNVSVAGALTVSGTATVTGLLTAAGALTVSGTATVTGLLSAQGGLRLNDRDLLLRGGTDSTYGIGWYGGSKKFGDVTLDGPVVYGSTGGGLGTTSGGQKVALAWDNSQNVGVAGGLTVSGLLSARGGARLYDHDLLLRGSTDVTYGIGWYGASKKFGDSSLDGPIVYGATGGALGSTSGGQKLALSWDNNQNVSVTAALTVTGTLSVQSDARINDKTLYLRGGTDSNHGMGWYGGTKLFATKNLDGPVVFGYSGGALGTARGSQKIALSWDYNQKVYYKQRPLPIVQSGLASAGRSEGSGERIQKIAVSFPFPFAETPQIVVALSKMDVDKGRNTRISVGAESISAAGFTVLFYTWADTLLYSADAVWIAYGTPTEPAG